MSIEAPFFPNDETGKHCFQAVFRMILAAQISERQFSMQDMLELTGAKEGRATWPAKTLLELGDLGLESVMIGSFNGKAFAERGVSYIRELMGDEVADWQEKYSDIPQERARYAELYRRGVPVIEAVPTLATIREYLSDGYLVQCGVNSKRLRNELGYVGHSVLVLTTSDDEVVLHNPGPPAEPYQHVPAETFEAAWAYPSETSKGLIAVRPQAVSNS
jgi:hypothetical protein